MSEISFFEVFAGTAVRSRPSSGRVSASSPCPSVPSRGLVPFRPRQPSPSVLLRRGGCSLPFLFPSCPSFSCTCSFPESPCPFPRGSLGSVVLLRALATPVRGCRLVPVGLLARRLPLLSCADACRAPGKRRESYGRRGKMPESAGAGGGKSEKKVEKVEKKSLKSLEIRQRALPLQSRSGRGPLGLLRGSGEVH